MKLSSKAKSILAQIDAESTKLGDLRKIAKEIKKDHTLALELWSSRAFLPRQLAILIMDPKQLSVEILDQLFRDMLSHEYDEKLHLADWLMANQLTKDKQTLALIHTWERSPSSLQRRIFWYHQARLRWVGQVPPPNTEELLISIEKNILLEEPEVQWAMNFTTGQIGIYQPEYRTRCIAIGENTGLYKDEIVPKNCTPNYLPDFISIQVSKIKV